MSDQTAIGRAGGRVAGRLGPTEFARAFRDLRPRLISAVALVAVTLVFLLAGAWPFAALVLGLALVMCWEWCRVVFGEGLNAQFAVQSVAVTVGVLLAAGGEPLIGLGILSVGCVCLSILTFDRNPILSAFGVVYVGLPAISLVWLRASGADGLVAVILILFLVSVADTAAFAGGRMVGGYKLWPSVSPNKTWSGFAFSVAASIVASLVFAAFYTQAPLLYAGALGLAIGVLSQGGDLAESALKRGHGVKDASGLIPGHGGVMDRLDGLVIAAIAAGILALLVNANAPGHAVLFGS